MLRACIDTNVWLSGFLFSGPPSDIVDLAMKRRFQVVSSPFLLDELERNLVNKFDVSSKAARRLRHRIVQIADVYLPTGSVKILGQSNPDNFVLETAWLGGCRYLVTGDRAHLLPLKIFKHTKIVDPTMFLSYYA